MLKFVNTNDGYTYTPKGQTGDEPFKVKLKVLPVEVLADLQDMLVTRTTTEVKTNYGAYYVQACLKGIIGWENIVDVDNKPIEMTKSLEGTIDRVSLNKIPYEMIEDIGNVILTVSSNPAHMEYFK